LLCGVDFFTIWDKCIQFALNHKQYFAYALLIGHILNTTDEGISYDNRGV